MVADMGKNLTICKVILKSVSTHMHGFFTQKIVNLLSLEDAIARYPGKVLVEKVWAHDIFIDFLAELFYKYNLLTFFGRKFFELCAVCELRCILSMLGCVSCTSCVELRDTSSYMICVSCVLLLSVAVSLK